MKIVCTSFTTDVRKKSYEPFQTRNDFSEHIIGYGPLGTKFQRQILGKSATPLFKDALPLECLTSFFSTAKLPSLEVPNPIGLIRRLDRLP